MCTLTFFFENIDNYDSESYGILSVIKCLDYLDGNPQEVRTEMPLVVLTKANLDEYTFWELEYQAEKYTPILKEMGYFAE